MNANATKVGWVKNANTRILSMEKKSMVQYIAKKVGQESLVITNTVHAIAVIMDYAITVRAIVNKGGQDPDASSISVQTFVILMVCVYLAVNAIALTDTEDQVAAKLWFIMERWSME